MARSDPGGNRVGRASRMKTERASPADTTARSAWQAVWRRREPVLWAVVVLAILTVQWPMLKGWYYRVSGAAAPASAVAWVHDVDQALAEARATRKKGVLVDFYASWCPPCMAMKHEVWPAPTVVQALGQDYLAVQVDADQDRTWAARYGVDTLPTVLLLDSEGRVVNRHTGFLPASGVVRMLTERGPR